MPPKLPTKKMLDKFLRLLEEEYWKPWQVNMATQLCESVQVILQGCRQAAGKTHITSRYCALCIIMGICVIIAMPTMKQAKSILFRRIASVVATVQKLTGIRELLPTESDTKTEKIYGNGAELLALSLDKVAEKEGYTTQVLVLDESQTTDRGVLGVFLPFIAVAKKERRAKTILLGRGGHEKSLIEEMKGEGFALVRITPTEILPYDPSWEYVFDEFKRDLSEEDYRQHILCETVSPGQHTIFPFISAAVPIPLETASKWPAAQNNFGIDVGRTSDRTCVAVLQSHCGYIDLVDVYYDTGPFTTLTEQGKENGQCVRVYAFIEQFPYRPGDMAIEINGLGVGLYDILIARYFHNIQGVHLLGATKKDGGMKKALINLLQKYCRDGIFRCANPEWMDELVRLQFEITDEGKYKWGHSDLLSAILMALASMQRVSSY